MTALKHKNFLAALLLTVLMPILAPTLATAQAMLTVNPAIELKVTIPPVLLVSVEDYSAHSLSIAGILGSAILNAVRGSGQKLFELREGSLGDLGSLNLFSNVPDKYRLSIISGNGGLLVPTSGDRAAGIPYRLKIGDEWADREGGTFVFICSGKSPKGGKALSLGLQVDEIPPDKEPGLYFDYLIFTISLE